MSAFLLSNEHIDALVHAGLTARGHHETLRWVKPGTNPTEYGELVLETATEVGRMLVEENVQNLIYLYDDRLTPDELSPDPYEYRRFHPSRPLYEAVEILKANQSYAYQCCDRPEWEQSEAKAFSDALRLHLIGVLPGYDEAAWAI